MLKSFENTETGMAATLHQDPRGVKLVLIDLDAERVAGVRIFPTLEAAEVYARMCMA